MTRTFSIRSALAGIAAIAVVFALHFTTSVGRSWIRLAQHQLATMRLEAALEDMRASVMFYGSKGIAPHRRSFPNVFVLGGRDVTEDSLMRLVRAIRTLDASESRWFYFKLCDPSVSNETVDKIGKQLRSSKWEVERGGAVVYRYPPATNS